MPTRYVELSPHDPDPTAGGDHGVSPVSVADRRVHAPDRTLLLLDDDVLVARCSCWWTGTPSYQGTPLGVIGHYAAADETSGRAILERACELLAGQRRTMAVGPMDGTTWRRYRFVVDRGSEPPFVLEPDNPDEWPGYWMSAGFETLATYSSAINDRPGEIDPRTDRSVAGLTAAGIRVRTLDTAQTGRELERIFALSLIAFRDNFLYTPIGRDEFMAQYNAVLPYVRPELVLMADRGDDLVGYMFSIPDVLQRMRGAAVDTVVLKTLAVHPSARGLGLGGALLDLAQRAARASGYRRTIHALFHDANPSGRISGRYARRMRRYALLARRLPS
jgi:GNAT superfamily N-acetyltransferase